jgi:lysozyme family protein
MASIEQFIPKLLALEGGFVNDQVDRGGVTNMGITLGSWRCMGYDKDGDGDIDADDIRRLDHRDLEMFLKHFYWDRWKADEIADQKVSEMLVDWLWCSGTWGVVIPQRILQVTDDGIVGPKTISAVNTADPGKLLISIYNARLAFIRNIVRRDYRQQRFAKGWVNRINAFL